MLLLMVVHGGGRVVWLDVVNEYDGGGKKEAAWQCLSHACRIWDDRCLGWDVFTFCFICNKAFVAQVATVLLVVLWLRV